jgi:hypothetical protein
VRSLLLLLAPLAVLHAESWQKISSGPFEILTSNDIKPAKVLLGTLEQMRGQLADLTGMTDPKPLWPIRIVIAKGSAATNLTQTAGVHSLLVPEAILSAEKKRSILALLLKTNAGPLEPGLEDALLTVLASLDADRVRVTLGAIPAREKQTEDWVLMEYLITTDSYRGRVRVFLSNLMKGTDKPTALKNAFEKPEVELRQEAALAKPSFAPVTFSARPILPERDYRARDVETEQGRLQLAIAQLADNNMRSNARKVCSSQATDPEAQACVAAAYALDGKADLAALEAEKALSFPQMLYLAATGQPDRLKHQQHLFTLLQLKPIYPEAALAFASKENDPAKAFKALKDASPAAIRDSNFQSQLAKWAKAAGLYAEESKAWAAAERAAFDPVRKEELRQARLGAQDRRYEAEAEARRAAEEARLKDIERVKQESLRRVREAEAKARGQLTPLPAGTKVEQWWDGEQADQFASGLLTRVDCIGGGRARFAIQPAEGKLMIYDVENPSKLILTGAGAETFQFSCGVQKQPRRVKVGAKNKRMLSMELLP